MGLVRQYESWDDRPVHPLTGAPADFFWERWTQVDGKCVTVREPRWYAGHIKNSDPSLSWFSPVEVAKMLGRTPRRIRQLLDAGELQGTQVNGRWYVRGSDLPGFVAGRKDVAPLPQPVKENRK